MWLFLIGYLIGVVITFFILIRWGEDLGWGGYDPPHGSYYDDYESNTHAWVSFSLVWFIFVPINIVVFSFRGLIKLGNKIREKFGS